MPADQSSAQTQRCPSCGATVDLSGEEPLARVACPQCGEKIRVERAFDNFVLLESLGVGGMGSVYKARDTRLDRLVALKLLRKDLDADAREVARLEQEARLTASVNHPHVIHVYSSGTDHAQFYIVMELVERGSLEDLIEQQKRVPETEVLAIGIQIARGLQAAHEKGLIHRDVKPANILFADEQTAKIGDFGLAVVSEEKAETRGEIWGTPYYVAPERLKNEPEDFRSDIFSLGATLFHAAAGRPPFEGETNSVSKLRELKENPLDLAQVAPELSRRTTRIINRMIAPDPAQRFASYDELIGELQKAHGKLTGTYDVDAKRSRKMAWIAGTIALLLALIAAGAFLFARKQQERTATIAKAAGQIVPLAELERQLADARRQLLAGHHNIALNAFARIAADAKDRQPLHDWARLQQGVAALIARDPDQAHAAFQDVERKGETGFANEDLDLAKYLNALAHAANSAETGTNFKQTSGGAEAFGLFLFAIKDVENLDVNDALPLLERFNSAKPGGKFAWINEYKPLAQKYLEDARLFSNWKTQTSFPNDAARLAALRDLKKKIKTRDAIAAALNAEDKTLAARAGVPEEKPAASPGQDRDTAKISPKKAEWLNAWKTKLIADLNRAHFAGEIVDVNGVRYDGVSSATAEQLSLKTPYGIVGMPWSNVAPKSLLAISMSFTKANAPDAADRQWLCAVFASQIGEMKTAQELGEAAAKAKPQYREQLSILSSH